MEELKNMNGNDEARLKYIKEIMKPDELKAMLYSGVNKLFSLEELIAAHKRLKDLGYYN